MNEDVKNSLINMHAALNQIHVHEKNNLILLLKSIEVLEALIKEITENRIVIQRGEQDGVSND